MVRSDLERDFERYRSRNDWRALAAVFDAVAPRLHALARHLAPDAAAAEDLVQATFLAAIEHKERFDPARDLAAWLGGILTNKAKLAAALRQREIDPERVAAREVPDPALDAEMREFVAALDAALQRVPARYRVVLRGHLADGKKPDEIARDLGRAPGTVRVQLHRGLARLRRLLPMSFALGLAPSMRPRGLDGVRREVLRAAKLATPSAAAVIAAAIGGSVMGAKLLVGGVVAAACAGLWWWNAASGDAPALIAAEPDAGTSARSVADAGPAQLAPYPPESRRSVQETEDAEATAERKAAAAALVEAPALTILARFVGPNDGDIELGSGTLILRAEDEPAREFRFVSENVLTLAGLSPRAYTVDLNAPGVVHRRQIFDLRDTAIDPRASEPDTERVVVWLPKWVAIVARTPDGRPFRAIADELGIDPKCLFVGAFAVKAWRDPGALPEGVDAAAAPATYWPPPRYQQWELPGDVIGSLETQPPGDAIWVELSVFGRPVGVEFVPQGAGEVVFTLDASAFESRFAQLAFKIVDRNGAPLPDARATLRADTSAHRRREQDKAAPGAGGRFEFERVVPGTYELIVERGDAFHQDRIELALAERRDLGAIVLGSGGRIELRVVDAEGRPVDAWIETGPYRRGESIERLYPPCLTRGTEGAGKGWIPMPSQLSILRVTHRERTRHYPTDDRCSNVLIDPTRPPVGPLMLVVHEPIEVTFDVEVEGAARLETLDELDLVVDSSAAESRLAVECELLPGRYRVRALDPAGIRIAESSFVVEGSEMRVAVR